MDKKEAWGSLTDDLLFVGITGGIASGKSEFAAEIENLGGFVIDADKISGELTLPGGLLNRKIVDEFGESVQREDETIDRKLLADIVFRDRSARARLEEISHPVIFDKIVEEAARYRRERAGGPPMVFVDAPLIVDTGLADIFDVLIVINAAMETRVKRLVELKGYTESEALSRVASQVSDEQRLTHADIVIDNDGELGYLRDMAGDVWRDLVRKAH